MTPDPTRSRPAARWRGPRVVVPAALLAAGIAVVAGRRPWLTGLVDDATLGRTSVGATGSQAVPGLVALALVIAAAALAAATSGPVLRRLTLVLGSAASLGLALLGVRAVAEADGILGALAATASGRTGTIPVTGVTTAFWPYAVAASAALSALASLAGLTGAGSWRGLSQRYDAPGEAAGGRGQRVSTAWDDLERGVDPTADPGAPGR
ncbi:MAG: Trp biosynthesis-associated membrane protein [Dermatophilaceae bacterium]